jgi:predicted nucleotidyltransferase
MATLIEILEKIKDNRDHIKKFGVRKLGVFGSVVRGEETGSSDIDFLVEFEKNTFDAFMGLNFFLEDLFGCEVDLVIADSIKPRIRPAIMEEVVYVPGL